MRSTWRATVATAATAVAATALLPSLATAAPAAPAWHISLSAGKSSVTVGHRIWLHGRIGTGAAGRHAKLQEQYDGRPWRTRRQVRVRADGSYTTYDDPARNHQRSYRVVLAPGHHHSRGVSPVVTVDVYGWVPLTSYPALNSVDMTEQPAVVIDTVTYPGSVEGFPTADGGPSSVEYNLDHLCTGFRATFGMSDDSQGGAQATVGLEVDGTSSYAGTFGLGQSATWQTRWATPPLKLHLQSQSLVASAVGHGVVASPEVLCTQTAEH